jgi:hypothetical protein
MTSMLSLTSQFEVAVRVKVDILEAVGHVLGREENHIDVGRWTLNVEAFEVYR